MASSLPSVLVLRHSFLRRLRDDIRSHFDSWADVTFGLSNDAIVYLLGGGWWFHCSANALGSQWRPVLVKID